MVERTSERIRESPCFNFTKSNETGLSFDRSIVRASRSKSSPSTTTAVLASKPRSTFQCTASRSTHSCNVSSLDCKVSVRRLLVFSSNDASPTVNSVANARPMSSRMGGPGPHLTCCRSCSIILDWHSRRSF